jgi:hypothetical protein
MILLYNEVKLFLANKKALCFMNIKEPKYTSSE